MVTTTTKVSVRTVLRVERTLKMAKPVLSNSKVKIVATLLPQRETQNIAEVGPHCDQKFKKVFSTTVF